MKASELRIGNIIQTHSGVIGKVVSIGSEEQEFEQLYCECDESYKWFFKDNYFGVPLTEEWLLKLGFERQPWGLVKGGLLFKDNIKHPCEELTLEIGNGFRVAVQYVHQLQNLYFALTNEELTYEQQK